MSDRGLLQDNYESQYRHYNNTTSTDFDNTGYQYQFTTLNNIINGFLTVYVGEGKLITRVDKTDIQFHAMRAIQEMITLITLN